MKFLRLAFYVLVAQLVLSGCAGEGVEETSSSSASEINFDAYVGRDASTRSDVTDIDFLKSGEWNAGFGVFARYGKTHLMDTEHVTWRGNHWGYDHIRFWPSSGKVDFYAAYSNGSDSCTMSITQSADSVQGYMYEKIPGEPEIYVANGFDHYIIQNTDTCIAAWYVDNLECSINTSLSVSDLKRAIDSIY